MGKFAPATLLLVVFCVFYTAYVFVNSAPVAAGADCGGYLGSAKLLAEGKLASTLRTVPEYRPSTLWAYTPHGYAAHENGEVVPTYPVGLPLQLAFATRLFGSHWGPLTVQVLGAVGSVALTYLLLRQLRFHASYAAAGAAAFGTSPLLLSVSYIPMSDGWATVWCLAAMIAGFRARTDARWAVWAGASAGMAFLVRPNNLLIVPALALALLHWRLLLRMALGATPFLLFGATYNAALYGAPWKTGYGGITDTLSATHALPSLANYARTLPFVLPLALGCILLPLNLRRLFNRDVLVLCLWAASFPTFFLFYSYTPTHWWYLRFILPALPAVLALGLLGWRALIESRPLLSRRRDLILTVLLTAVFGLSIYWAVIKKINRSAREQSACAETARWIEQNLPADTLVGCSYLSAAMYYYTTMPVLRWEYMAPETFAELRGALGQSGRPLILALRSFETEPAFTAMPGNWKPLATFRYFTLWRLDPTAAAEDGVTDRANG